MTMFRMTSPKAAVARLGLAGALSAVVIAVAIAQAGPQTSATFTPGDESPEEFPAGSGRDETFYACTACHNFKLVAAQGMTRRQWDDSLDWMTERHNMPKIEGKERETILGYLETTYPPRAPAARGGWQNPFLNR